MSRQSNSVQKLINGINNKETETHRPGMQALIDSKLSQLIFYEPISFI